MHRSAAFATICLLAILATSLGSSPASCGAASPELCEDLDDAPSVLQLGRVASEAQHREASVGGGAAGGTGSADRNITVGDDWISLGGEVPPITWWPLHVKPKRFKTPKSVWAEDGNITLVITTCDFYDDVSKKSWVTRCYNGTIPGPTIHVKPGTLMNITVKNLLRKPSAKPITLEKQPESVPESDLIHDSPAGEKIEDYLIGTGSLFGYVNDTNLHTHGLVVASNKPADDVLISISSYDEKRPQDNVYHYSYPVPDWHASGTHWYHPHRHHATTHQASGGAFGALIVDDIPGELNKPYGSMPERLLNINVLNVSMWETIGVLSRDNLANAALGVNSELALVNGLDRMKMTIYEGKWYRFRIVYASNIRALRMSPFSWDGAKCEMKLIAKDVFASPFHSAAVAAACRGLCSRLALG